jgi:hypothetical protein
MVSLEMRTKSEAAVVTIQSIMANLHDSCTAQFELRVEHCDVLMIGNARQSGRCYTYTRPRRAREVTDSSSAAAASSFMVPGRTPGQILNLHESAILSQAERQGVVPFSQ